MEIKQLAIELEEWAQGKGWKTVTQLITPFHSGKLLEPLEDIADADEFARRLHNNTQIIQRAFRKDTANYRKQAEQLSYAVRAAMDAEADKTADAYHQAAIANKECIEATSAVLMRKPQAIINREALEAITELAKLVPGLRVTVAHSAGQVA